MYTLRVLLSLSMAAIAVTARPALRACGSQPKGHILQCLDPFLHAFRNALENFLARSQPCVSRLAFISAISTRSFNHVDRAASPLRLGRYLPSAFALAVVSAFSAAYLQTSKGGFVHQTG